MSKGLGVKHCIVREFSVFWSQVYGIFFPEDPKRLAYVVKTMKGHTSELAKELSSLQKTQ